MARRIDYKKFAEHSKNVSKEDFQKFAGASAEKFEKTRQAMLNSEQTRDIPLLGFLFFPFYAAYYKQWPLMIFYSGTVSVTGYFFKGSASLAVLTALSVVYSGFFKQAYVGDAYKKINEINNRIPDQFVRDIEIKKIGKSAWWGPLVAVAFIFFTVFVEEVIRKLTGNPA